MVALAVLGITLNPLTLAKDVTSALTKAALAAFGSGASALVGALLGFIDRTSDPVFSGGWWSGPGEALFVRVSAISASLLALAFVLSIVSALLAGDHTLLARAALRLPSAVLMTAMLVAVIAALVSASDEVSSAIAAGATGGLKTFVAGELATAVAGSGIVGLVSGGLVILAALAIWAELLCRSALIYLAVLIGPLIFAASVHPSLGGLRRRYVEGSLALICSKVVVALALATGSAMLSGLGRSASFDAAVGALMEALAVLLVACFAPFVLLRLFVGAEAIAAAEGLARRPVRGATAAMATVSAASGFSTLLRGLGGASETGAAAAAGRASPTAGGAGPMPPAQGESHARSTRVPAAREPGAPYPPAPPSPRSASTQTPPPPEPGRTRPAGPTEDNR